MNAFETPLFRVMAGFLALSCACGTVTDESDGPEIDGPEADAGPTDALSDPARLEDLNVEGLTLVPEFDPEVTSYTAQAPFFIDAVRLVAVASDQLIHVEEAAVASGEPTVPVSLDLGVTQVSIEVGEPGLEPTLYTVSISRGQGVLDYIKASNTDPGDGFGTSIALDGDLLAVGAPFEAGASTSINGDESSNEFARAGAVYIFARDPSGVWQQEAYLKPAELDVGDLFGFRMALDGETLVVGSVAEDSASTGINGLATDNNASSAGAVWVFTRDGGSWSQQAYIKGSNSEQSDFFGGAVAIDGDTLVVAARGEDAGASADPTDNAAESSGAVYVFVRSDGVWSQQAYLKASNAESADQFGSDVGISGDTIVVGALGEDSLGSPTNNSGSAAGAAYVFVRNGAFWSQQAYLKASNPDAGDQFGIAVAIDGDTLAIGARQEDSAATGVDGDQLDSSAPDSGAVYVFVRDETRWTQQAYLKASNTGSVDRFGDAVALDGDRLLVSARSEDSSALELEGDQSDDSATDSGAAYLFTRRDGVWRQTTYVKSSNAGAGDGFGSGFSGAAISGDTVAVGAPREDSSATGVNGEQTDDSAAEAGAVFVIR